MLPWLAILSSLIIVTAQPFKGPPTNNTTISHKTCNVPHGLTDDTPGLLSLLQNCSTNSRIVFEQGITYNISTPVNFGTLKNVEIAILGDLDLPKFIPYVQSLVNASTGQRLYWFTAAGDNVTISGNLDTRWGNINSYGDDWWLAAQLVAPGGLPLRPHGWSLKLTNSVLRWLKINRPIGWGISLAGSNIHVYDVHIDASYDLSNPSLFPFNTDGFDLSAQNVLIEDSWIFNGDDCVAVNAGAMNVTIRNMTCIGGHGLSISATGNVSNVVFKDSTSISSLYATRFKSSLNSVGNITNVTWSNIKVVNATFPIFATSVYIDQNTNRGANPVSVTAASNATHITDFTWENISGTVNSRYPGDGSCITVPCWYYVQNATNTEAIIMQLLNNTATNIRTSNINLKPDFGSGKADVMCNSSSFVDGVANLGFRCTNGPYLKV